MLEHDLFLYSQEKGEMCCKNNKYTELPGFGFFSLLFTVEARRCFAYGQELSDYFALSDSNDLFKLPL